MLSYLKEFSINRKDNEGFFPLHSAIYYNASANKIQAILRLGGKPNLYNAEGHSTFHLAAGRFRYDLLDDLIANGDRKDSITKLTNQSALTIALRSFRKINSPRFVAGHFEEGEQLDRCKTFLIKLRKINFKNNRRSLPKSNLLETVKHSQGMEIYYDLPDIWCAIDTYSQKVVRLVLDLNVPVNSVEEVSLCPLHKAIEQRMSGIIEILLQKGCDPNQLYKRYKGGFTDYWYNRPLDLVNSRDFEIRDILRDFGGKTYAETDAEKYFDKGQF